MTYTNGRQCWLLWMFPFAAFAAEPKLLDGLWAPVIIFGFVQLVSGFGHVAASLTDWATWADATGTAVEVARRKLKLIQGLSISVLAGNACYYGGMHFGQFSEIPGLIGAGVAAYGGDRFITPILTRITGK